MEAYIIFKVKFTKNGRITEKEIVSVHATEKGALGELVELCRYYNHNKEAEKVAKCEWLYENIVKVTYGDYYGGAYVKYYINNFKVEN